MSEIIKQEINMPAPRVENIPSSTSVENQPEFQAETKTVANDSSVENDDNLVTKDVVTKPSFDKEMNSVEIAGNSFCRTELDPKISKSFKNMTEAKAHGIGPEKYADLPLAA